MPKTPQYRQRPGYSQAIVTLTDSKTKKRRDYWLGAMNTQESREKYHVVIAAWEAKGRCFPDPADPTNPIRTHPVNGRTLDVQTHVDNHIEGSIIHLIRAYWAFAKGYYRPTEHMTLKIALRVLKQFYGSTPVDEFGPVKLRVVRESMIQGDLTGQYPRGPWSRKYINHQCCRICRMFKWGASHELAPVAVYQSLSTMEPLKLGRTTAREGKVVGPVSMEMVNAVRPFVSRQVAALIDLQLLTGARSGELIKIRACDIDTSEPDGVWHYVLSEHKTSHQGKPREIFFGPAAQKVLEPFIQGRHRTDYLFSPAEANEERREKLHELRKTPLSCGNRPGTNVSDEPQFQAGECYTSSSYGQAIVRGCELAYPPPPPLCKRLLTDGSMETHAQFMKRLKPSQKEDLLNWKREHRWHPHQLRHNAATNIRKQFGLEAAQLLLGHSSSKITDAVYAERDSGKVVAIAKQVG